jgi:hypothetical protein
VTSDEDVGKLMLVEDRKGAWRCKIIMIVKESISSNTRQWLGAGCRTRSDIDV